MTAAVLTAPPVAPPEDRKLVSIETVVAVDPIDGADAIEAATVRGWTVVVKKGEVAAGDRVVYFEIDSLLPLADDRFAFLEARGQKLVDGVRYHRLKTARLRGCYSQGLVLPLDAFSGHELVAANLQEVLGVIKYEPPQPGDGGQIKGTFPDHLAARTDSTRVQNLGKAWDKITAVGWFATEKVDGTSLSVLRGEHGPGDWRVCSRNNEITDGDNLYWNAVRDEDLIDLLELHPEITGVQGEVIGEFIQGNGLGIRGRRILLFSVLAGRRHLPRREWPDALLDMAVPIYDLPFPATPADAVAQVDGIKSLVAPGRLAEGVVWHTTDGEVLPALNYRSTWKAISNRWLLKNEG